MSNADKLRDLESQMAIWGSVTIHSLNNGDLIYGESKHGLGLPVEMIVRDGCITFLSLDNLYFSDYATSEDQQSEAINILECVVGGGAALIKTARGCHLFCGNVIRNEAQMRAASRYWTPWCEPVVVESTISLSIRC